MKKHIKNNWFSPAQFVLVIAALIYFLSGCKGTQKLAEQKNTDQSFDIYLLIGQSNMAGRAEIEMLDMDTLAGVFLYKGIKGEEWEKAANPLNKYSTIRKKLSMQKLGPGYTFAMEMSRNTKNPIGLIVNAKGGTGIDLWAPDSLFYREAIKRTKNALKYGDLKGILWHQGESDVSRYDTYLSKIIDLISALRSEFEIPDLPVVVGQLSEDKEQRISFNNMILRLPEHLPYVAVVSSKNTSTFDSTHFDARSQRLMGERYAKEMMKLLND